MIPRLLTAMFNPVQLLSAVALSGTLLLSSCASIITRPSRDVSIQSNPTGLAFNVTNKDGEIVHSGTTPQVVNLTARGGYFVPAKYTIEVKKGSNVIGSKEVTAGVNGWYAGNVLLGGLVGLIIVDPLTGAMYRMPKTIMVDTTAPAADASAPALTITTLDTVSKEERGKLVRI